VTAAPEAAGAGQRIALGMNTEGAVTLDKLALDSVAFPAVTGAAHRCTRAAAGACGRCYGRAGRAIGAVRALASLSTPLGTTAGRGSGARNICAGHSLCTRLLAAGGPKLGEARRPGVGIGAQDERLAAKLHGTQAAGAYLLICRLTADPVRITKVFER
jgi:hypothetical protein